MITHKNAIAMLSGLVYLVEKVSHFAAKHCNYIKLRERKRNLTSSGPSACIRWNQYVSISEEMRRKRWCWIGHVRRKEVNSD